MRQRRIGRARRGHARVRAVPLALAALLLVSQAGSAGTTRSTGVGTTHATGPSNYPQTPVEDDAGSMLPAVLVGAIALGAVGNLLANERKLPEEPELADRQVHELLRDGPRLPRQFNQSAFAARALVKAGWPVVIDYEQRGPAVIRLRFSARGAEEVVSYRLDGFGPGRHLVRFELPELLGGELKPAVVGITAARDPEQRDTTDAFVLRGLGLGPRAVGSIAVDELRFSPNRVYPEAGESVAFRFHSLSRFERAAVEFMHLEYGSDGERLRFVNQELLPDGVDEDAWVGKPERRAWDGRDTGARISEGLHRLQVRVWDGQGDWIASWSDEVVDVAR